MTDREMSRHRKELGDLGEAVARRYLTKHGYAVIESNYRCRYGEIDLVATEGDCVVFVEVKSRSNRSFGVPAESITRAKRQRLIESAQDYLQTHDGLPEMWRIDVVTVEVEGPGRRPRVELIRNAVS